jgi:hypothetical protein
MQRPAFAAILAVALGLFAGTTPVRAQTMDPCTVYTCMAGLSGDGTTGGPACTPAIMYWHTTLAVYSPYFNPPASAARRRAYLMTCPGAQVATNAAILNAIMAQWGYSP